MSASILVLWLAIFVRGISIRPDRATGRAALSGLLEPGLAYAVGITGLALTTASNAALIGAAEPLFILGLAWLFPKERVGPALLGLAALATFGILCVVIPDAGGMAGGGSFVGDALIVVGTLFAALYVIATRRLVGAFDPLSLSALQQSVGLIFTLPVLGLAVGMGLTTIGIETLSPGVLAVAALSRLER